MTESQTTKMTLADRCSKTVSWIAGFFTLLTLAIFPLVFGEEYYGDIMFVKYKFYYVSMIGMFVILLLLALAFLIVDMNRHKGAYTERFLNRFRGKQFVKTVTVPSIAMLAFWGAALISTLNSDYFFESFWGNEGRLTGLFLISIYTTAFLIISHCLRPKQWFLDAFLAGTMLMCLFGITDYFQMDILGFQEGIVEHQRGMFTSTIGNINTYTAFSGMVLAVAATLFGTEKNKLRALWYFICSVIAIAALITGLSDNAYLSLAALFAFLPLYLFNSRRGVKRYAVLVAAFFSVSYWVQLVNLKMPDQVLKITGLFRLLAGYDRLGDIVIALWVIVGVLYILDWLWKKPGDDLGNAPRYAWGVVILLAAGGIGYILYDANLGGNAERYSAFSQYLIFNDNWGTHRGYIWRIGLEAYQEFPLMDKLFGYGPESYGMVTYFTRAESSELYGEVYDNAHNEYIQYLTTIGLVGLLAYLSVMGTSLWTMAKKCLNKPFVMATFFAVICYCAQATVNLCLPIATPVMWTLLMVGLAGCREQTAKD